MKPNIGAGDKGTTALLFGKRVSKADAQPEAYGTVDELTSTLGLAKALCQQQYTRDVIESIQKDLGIVAAELATEPERHEDLGPHGWLVTDQMVKRLEDIIVDVEHRVTMPTTFVIPGATSAGAAIDMARAVDRRAERRVVSLSVAGQLPNDRVAAYLNRLSDVLFALARYEEASERDRT
ncbi:MAG TPA: cob(I)yrinic acid a,c-diamide adenosyltransferase [Candidatus Cryosericum sp.]|jgi:cob(I)alamin adenosyltransferase|nr:cob(I)yrinic acid a,c-diamide adenosyltransferase [Candidatus Cryosericum sp.]HPS69204.1 cob(I)yrinic acid a,c-diamide adenosyltransferase [Candidatus Cryosericum sp.]